LERVVSGLVLVTPEGGKTARAHASEPPLADGKIVLPHPDLCPLVWTLLFQAEAFPRDVHDDIVDMLTQAIIWLMSHNYADFSAAMRAVIDASKKG
jgi:predicted phage terminase large subunit-like protein